MRSRECDPTRGVELGVKWFRSACDPTSRSRHSAERRAVPRKLQSNNNSRVAGGNVNYSARRQSTARLRDSDQKRGGNEPRGMYVSFYRFIRDSLDRLSRRSSARVN